LQLGTPVDVTLSELALETFFPADDATAARNNPSFRDALFARTRNPDAVPSFWIPGSLAQRQN
jgi:hypothetical protein